MRFFADRSFFDNWGFFRRISLRNRSLISHFCFFKGFYLVWLGDYNLHLRSLIVVFCSLEHGHGLCRCGDGCRLRSDLGFGLSWDKRCLRH